MNEAALRAIRRTLAVARKDLTLEWRGRETIAGMLLFVLLIVLLLGFVFDAEPARAPVVLWVALGLGAMVGVARPLHAEAEQGALETLLLYPGSREHLFWGKWGALTALLVVLLGIGVPVVALLFNIDLWSRLALLLGYGVLASAGLAAAGTLFAALTLHVRGRELLMPLLLLPVVLPVVLAAVRLTESAIAGTPPGLWLGTLIVVDVVFLTLAPLLFDLVVEEA